MTAEEPGRLSNPTPRPVQRRLDSSEVDQLVAEYLAGRTLRELAGILGVHHRTIAGHLEQRGAKRRANPRKMSTLDVLAAARRYETGDSLATVAQTFNVDTATSRRELPRAGVAIRPRRGWS